LETEVKSRTAKRNTGTLAATAAVMASDAAPDAGDQRNFATAFVEEALGLSPGLPVEKLPGGARYSVLQPGSRHPVNRYQSVPRDRVVSQLEAAKIRIAELEFALREAGEVASQDPLTGVLNRRGMTESFERESARSRRNGEPLALALIDLDDFKLVNDQHGHAVGDAALVHLTRLIGRTLRPTDICCRLGGEEFVVMMPGSDSAAATRALDRLQAVISSRPVTGTSVLLAFSAGVVQAQAGESLELALARADGAVYRAKLAGKRRTVCC
jgi:diguanylate cyclase (GGDEF)-like protein